MKANCDESLYADIKPGESKELTVKISKDATGAISVGPTSDGEGADEDEDDYEAAEPAEQLLVKKTKRPGAVTAALAM